MKLKIFIFPLLIALSLNSCSEEPINFQCADPLGSDGKSLSDKKFTCFQEDINGCFWFHLNVTEPILQSVYVEGHSIAMVLDIGEVACLSEVTEKPSSGFVFVTPAKLNHGYVVKMADGTLGRMYIDSWKKQGDLVTEVNIIRQYPY